LNGTYTIPSPGDYRVSGAVVFAANGTGIRAARIIAGGTTYPVTSGIAAHALDDNFCLLNQTIPNLKVGDTIVIQGYQNSGGNLSYSTNATRVIIEKLQSPTTISATARYSARYTTAAAQSIATGSAAIVDFGTKDWDDFGSVTTGGSWKFSPQMAGVYEICPRIMYDAQAFSADDKVALTLYKNGSEAQNIVYYEVPTTVTTYVTLNGCAMINLLSSDYIDVRTSQNSGGSRTLIASALYNWVTIKLIK
jgi:hypothetical protein